MQLIPTPQALRDALSLLQLLLLVVYAPVLAYALVLALGWIPILMSLFEGVPFWGPGPHGGKGGR